MALTFTLGPNPKWYIADLVGRPLAGGYLATFSNLDHSILNPVFTDASGLFTWPYVTIPNVGILGVLFDENGSQGPFYFQFNSAVPSQLYFLEVFDANGVLQWTIDNYIPPGAGGGGGGTITTAVNLNNIVTNNIMLRNTIGYTDIPATQVMSVAPGAHSGLAKTTINAGPDIVFLKTNLTGTDTIGFHLFSQGETFPNGEPTPVDYLKYSCSVAGTTITQKCVQFPITHGVQNIQSQAVTVSIFARATAGTDHTLTLNWLQFFGDGPAASLPNPFVSPIQTFTLTSSWQKLVILGTVIPSTTGKVIGECGNDGLFLQVQFPFTATTTIDFTQPQVIMGNITPSINFSPNDALESVMYSPRTGYIFPCYDLTTATLGGYLPLDDGTIGSATSGATHANINTFPLYNLLYNNVTLPSGNALCTVTGFTGDPVADFVANRKMNLPVSLGRAMCAAGAGAGLTSRSLGSIVGSESHLITINELPAHQHDDTAGNQFVTKNDGNNVYAPGAKGSLANTTGFITGQGAITALSLMQPSSFVNFFIKL